jgi:hypothetical protein
MSARAHLVAACVVVAAIAGVITALYFGLVAVSALSTGDLGGGLNFVLVPVLGLSFAVATWLFLYLPLSVIAEVMSKTTAVRVWLPAATLVVVVGLGLFFLLNRRDQLPEPQAEIILLGAVVALGLGCALYSVIKEWLVRRAVKGQTGAART